MRLVGLMLEYIQVYSSMYYEWHPEKSENNLRERGFDFDFATIVFSGLYLAQEDLRRSYGERRVVAIGRADGSFLTVVFTDRTSPQGALVRRIISARLSNRKERQAYVKAFSEIDPQGSADSRPR